MLRIERALATFTFLGVGAVLIACGGGRTTSNSPSPPPRVAASPTVPEQFDVIRPSELRSGPGTEYERIINQKATDALGEVHYLSVDTSVTVTILKSEGEWAEIQVIQPEHLRDSHRGWVQSDVVKGGAATDKREGWIRHACRVYPAPDSSTEPVGILSPPSSVGVADDCSGWLRLVHGPVKDEATDAFLDVDFVSGLFIEKSNFTTELPAKWNQ